MLKPEEKRCYVCGSTKHMANECDRPKREDPKANSKGEKGKTDKGKGKGKTDDGKGKPAVRQVTETTKDQEDAWTKSQNKKEPDAEPQLTEFEKTVVKALRDKKRILETRHRRRCCSTYCVTTVNCD